MGTSPLAFTLYYRLSPFMASHGRLWLGGGRKSKINRRSAILPGRITRAVSSAFVQPQVVYLLADHKRASLSMVITDQVMI